VANALEVVKSLGENLHTSVSVKNVFGDPISVGDKIVIPVARFGYGFGAGGGSKAGSSPNQQPQQSGGGGGGGVGAEPAGVLEITPTETRFIPFTDRKRMGAAVAAGFLMGVFFARRKKRNRH
jgi:uncharacterized spore protein YtfJ